MIVQCKLAEIQEQAAPSLQGRLVSVLWTGEDENHGKWYLARVVSCEVATVDGETKTRVLVKYLESGEEEEAYVEDGEFDFHVVEEVPLSLIQQSSVRTNEPATLLLTC